MTVKQPFIARKGPFINRRLCQLMQTKRRCGAMVSSGSRVEQLVAERDAIVYSSLLSLIRVQCAVL